MVSAFEIKTCSDSLLTPGVCCICRQPATVAALSSDFTEHARCETHGTGDHFLAVKPLRWDPKWGPTDADH